MSIVLATNCLQIEMAVPDVRVACTRFEHTLGAVPIEEELVRRISGVVLDIDHRDCGGAVFQFCSPLIDDIPAAHELRRIGPCVTNLTFFLDDAAGAQRELEAAGAVTRLQWRMGGSWLKLLGEGNARRVEELADGYFVGTRSLFGFDLEFSEPPWIDPAKQRYMCPAFTSPRPQSDGRVERLHRLRVEVDDLDRYVGNVVRLIDERSRTPVYGERVTTRGRTARIALRGLELEYVESAGGVAEPGITTAVFGVADLAEWPERRFATRDVMGIDLEVEASQER